MTDALHLTTVGGKRDIQSRVHVQFPNAGHQVWNMHIDKLEKWNTVMIHIVFIVLHGYVK